jgi:hypothetical protein
MRPMLRWRLKHKVDVLWIGARTTVNPFAVQEIAEALRGVDIPVMVKNPMNPDLQLWIGALERLHAVGIISWPPFIEVFLILMIKDSETNPIGPCPST